MNPVEVDSVSEQGETNKKTKIQRQRRSYGNTVSLPSLKTNFFVSNTFFDDSSDSSDGSDYVETGLQNMSDSSDCNRYYCYCHHCRERHGFHIIVTVDEQFLMNFLQNFLPNFL